MAPATVTKVGNLTKDLELLFSPKGMAYARSSIAVDIAGPGGDWVNKETVFYDITVFGQMAENAAESLGKGDRVIVEGKPETKEYTKKNGTQAVGKSIAVNEIGLNFRYVTATVHKVERDEPQGFDELDDEVPF